MEHLKPRFSIVIPCYNEARYITQTLKSLQRQTYVGSYEIIVVDNNCTDDTVNIALSYGVRTVAESRTGVCWARQAGTEAARGEIVISTDADTIYPEDWLQTIDTLFQKYKKCVAVTGPCVYRDGPWWGKQYPKILFGTVNAVSKLIGRPFYVTATNIAFKKSAWTQYRTTLTQGGDELALLHDLKKKGRVIFTNANPVYTSGRRLSKGLIYNLFVTFLIYYLLAYYVNRALGKTVIGTYPAFRIIKPAHRRWATIYGSMLVVPVAAFVHLPRHDTLLHQLAETFGVVKNSPLPKRQDASPSSSHLSKPTTDKSTADTQYNR